MWAQVENNIATRVYPRATPLQRKGVNHPRDIFRNSKRLAELGIYPVRRVQLNAPDDTTGWESVEVYIFKTDYVEQAVTWTKRADFTEKVAERDADLARQDWQAKRSLVADFLYSQGRPFYAAMRPTDEAAFALWDRAQQEKDTVL